MNNSHDQITVNIHNCFASVNQPFYVSKYSCCDIMQELCELMNANAVRRTFAIIAGCSHDFCLFSQAQDDTKVFFC